MSNRSVRELLSTSGFKTLFGSDFILDSTVPELGDIVWTENTIEKHKIHGITTPSDTLWYRRNGGTSYPLLHGGNIADYAATQSWVGDNYYTKTEVDNLITSSNADKFVTTISTSQEVEHMLNTYDISAEFYDIATMFTVGARVQRLTTNKIKVEFDTVPTNPIKVLIRKF